MGSQLDTAFFRKAKKVDRAIEIFDHEAVIPAVKEKPEIRVKLPVRRLKTIEERTDFVQENLGKIELLDGEIEQERKNLLDLVKVYRVSGSGGSDVVATNLRVKGLMERRSALVSPDRWIEEIPGLSFKDVFASKRDVRKIGASVYQIKRRTEPIESLYVNLVAPQQQVPEGKEEPDMPPPATSDTSAGKKVRTTAEVAQGAIIGQKKVIKTKKVAASLPASGATFST